jgi:Transglutaminase-like superfamily
MACWKSLLDKLNKARALGPGERWVLARAVALVLLTRVAVRFVGWRRWHAFLAARLPAERRLPGGGLTEARATARVVRAVARRLAGRKGCLPHALALWWLLRRQGIAGDLHFGVRKRGGMIEAHAWVQCQELVFDEMDPSAGPFQPFDQPILPPGVRFA